MDGWGMMRPGTTKAGSADVRTSTLLCMNYRGDGVDKTCHLAPKQRVVATKFINRILRRVIPMDYKLAAE